MKMTLEIPDDVVRAAEELARCEHKTAGEVISDLAREALLSGRSKNASPTEFLGFRPFPNRGGVVTNEIINDLREKDGV